MRFKKASIIYCLLLIVCLSYFAVRPLFHSGFFPMHDDTQVVRVFEMAQSLKDGQFPVRWVAGLGYGFGYPLFNFYAPLAYYFGAFFILAGFNALIATKIMFGFGLVAAGVFMYFLVKEFWGSAAGVVAGLFYIYAPYHAVDVYVRGAVGEFWAMVFLPLVFLGVYKIFRGDRWGIIVGALGFTGVILSHNLTTLMLIPFLFLIWLALFAFSKDKKQFGVWSLEFGALAVGLAAFYWLPALKEMTFTKVYGQIGGGADWRDHFVFPDQLWASPWGFGGSAPGRLDGMSFMVGKIHLLALLISLLVAVWVWRKRRKKEVFVLFSAFFVFLVAVFLTTKFSYFFWQLEPEMAFIQYPWRFLIFAILAASFIVGALPAFFGNSGHRYVVAAGMVALLILFNVKYFQPRVYFNKTSADYINVRNIKWKTSRISDEYLPKNFPVPRNENEAAWEKIKVLSGEAEIKTIMAHASFSRFIVDAKTEAKILINTAYFPGWQLKVDGRSVKPEVRQGKMEFSVALGKHQIELSLVNTPVRRTANLISFFSIGLLIVSVLKYGYGRNRVGSD